MTSAMTKAAREGFLAGLHVGVLSVEDPGHGPLMAPVWYWYEPGGDVRFVTGAGSRKGRLLKQSSRASLCVQNEQPPYAYVTVEGPVSIEKPEFERDIRAVARRYLGERAGDRYVAQTGGETAREASILVRLQPQRWLAVDYGKRRS
jgi:PPOX class probable F420-dependent enzyme